MGEGYTGMLCTISAIFIYIWIYFKVKNHFKSHLSKGAAGTTQGAVWRSSGSHGFLAKPRKGTWLPHRLTGLRHRTARSRILPAYRLSFSKSGASSSLLGPWAPCPRRGETRRGGGSRDRLAAHSPPTWCSREGLCARGRSCSQGLRLDWKKGFLLLS